MSWWDRVCCLAGGVVAPQRCVLCDDCVVNARWVPLCASCRNGLQAAGPRNCHYCALPVAGHLLDSEAVCRACRIRPPFFDRGWSWGRYGGDLRRLLHAYKFDRVQALSWPLSAMLYDVLEDIQAGPYDEIIPVPSHPSRTGRRGFDAALLIARRLSRLSGIPIHVSVRRTRSTRAQHGLTRAQRVVNLSGAFEWIGAPGSTRGRVLVLDDIHTTGATLNELCGLVRRQGGASEIHVLTVARAVLGGDGL